MALELIVSSSVGVVLPDKELFYEETLGRTLTRKERVKKAAWYIKESVKGKRFFRRGKWGKRFNRLYTSWAWRWFIFIIVLIHMSFARWEATSYRVDTTDIGRRLQSFEIVFCLVYWVDILLKPSLGGWRHFLRGWDDWSFVLTTIVCTLDVLVATSKDSSLRVSRPFRPLLLVTSSAKLRDILGTVVKSIPKLFEIFVAFVALILLYAVMGMNIYAGYYPSKADGDFNSFSSSCLSLFVLSTSENYPDIMRPAYDRNNLSAIYFISFIILAVFLMMNVIIAIVLEAYKAIRENKVRRDFNEENKALDASFALLDMDNDGIVLYEDWVYFLKYAAPRYNEEQAGILFNHLDRNGRRGLSRGDWDQLVDTLLLRFRKRRKVNSYMPRCLISCFSGLTNTMHDGMHQAHSRCRCNPAIFKVIVLCVIIANLVVLGLVGSVDNDEEAINTFYSLNIAFLTFFICEHLLRIVALGGLKFFESFWNRFDVLITFTQVVITIALVASHPHDAFEYPNNSMTVRVLQGLFGLRALRLVSLFERVRGVTASMIEVLPVIMIVFALVVCIQYSFDMVALELFSASGTGQFTDFVEAYLTLFQLLTGSNWHELMYAQMNASSNYASWFYVVYIMLIVVLIMNIVIAIVVDVFVQQMSLLEAAKAGEFLKVMKTSDGKWKVWKSNMRWERELFANIRQVAEHRHIELRDDVDIDALRRDTELMMRENAGPLARGESRANLLSPDNAAAAEDSIRSPPDAYPRIPDSKANRSKVTLVDNKHATMSPADFAAMDALSFTLADGTHTPQSTHGQPLDATTSPNPVYADSDNYDSSDTASSTSSTTSDTDSSSGTSSSTPSSTSTASSAPAPAPAPHRMTAAEAAANAPDDLSDLSDDHVISPV